MERTRRSKSRLARLAATALSVPALLFSAAAPAQAANIGSPTAVVTAPSTAVRFERATITVKVTENGVPLANQLVTVSLDSISVAVLGNASKSPSALGVLMQTDPRYRRAQAGLREGTRQDIWRQSVHPRKRVRRTVSHAERPFSAAPSRSVACRAHHTLAEE